MESEISKQIINLSSLTEQELVLEIQSHETIGIRLNELKKEFHSRIKNRLFQYCQKLCQRNRFDESVAKDIFQESLRRALSKIRKFRFEASTNSIFPWLNTIVFNLFIDYLRRQRKTKYLDVAVDDIECEDLRPDDFEFEVNESTNVILQQAWDDLDERERLIFYFCIQYNCLDNNDHLPDNIIFKICDALKITKGNIRTIKSRALKRLRTKFQ